MSKHSNYKVTRNYRPT